jgi:hypothetical protein
VGRLPEYTEKEPKSSTTEAEMSITLRPYMIVHSADGVFAIRKGPWKWIEGKPAKPKPPQARRDEFRPQLYHLGNDIGETTDVEESNPAVVAELTAHLNRCREQGYSRE